MRALILAFAASCLLLACGPGPDVEPVIDGGADAGVVEDACVPVCRDESDCVYPDGGPPLCTYRMICRCEP